MLVTAGYCAKALEEEKVEGAAIGKSVAVIVGVGLLFDMLQNYQPRAGVYVSCVLVLIVGGVCAFLWKQKKNIADGGAVLLLFCMTWNSPQNCCGNLRIMWKVSGIIQSTIHHGRGDRRAEEYRCGV